MPCPEHSHHWHYLDLGVWGYALRCCCCGVLDRMRPEEEQRHFEGKEK